MTDSILQFHERMKGWILNHARHAVGCKWNPCSCGLAGLLDDLDPSVDHDPEEDDGEPTPVDLDPQTALLQQRLSDTGVQRRPRKPR